MYFYRTIFLKNNSIKIKKKYHYLKIFDTTKVISFEEYMLLAILYLFIYLFQSAYGVVGSNGNVSSLTQFTDMIEFVAGGPVRIDLMPHLFDQNEKKNWNISLFTQYFSSPENTTKLATLLFPSQDILLTTTGGPDYFLSTATNKEVRDLDASILGITDKEFFSITGIFPQSTKKYLGFFGYYAFSQNENNTPKFSLQVAAPFISINHTIGQKEKIYKQGRNNNESPIKNVIDGLSSSNLLFQRWNFSNEGISNTEISNIELNLSWNYFPLKKCSIETYAGCLIPVTKKTKTEKINQQFIFSPTITNSEHFGLQYGTTISLFLYENDERTIQFILGNNLLYFIPEKKLRSFDLKQKPWSRYLPVYENFALPDQLETSLVNKLTLSSRITPNFSNVATVQIDFTKSFYALGIGYTLFTRQSESVTILDDLPNIAIKGTSEVLPGENMPLSVARTASLQLSREDVICQNPVYEDPNFFYTKIETGDIDISSATHPAVFLGEIYLKLKLDCLDTLKCVLGGSYRFCHNNTAIEYSTCWAGIQYEF